MILGIESEKKKKAKCRDYNFFSPQNKSKIFTADCFHEALSEKRQQKEPKYEEIIIQTGDSLNRGV